MKLKKKWQLKTDKKETRVNWVNLPNLRPESWHQDNLIEPKPKYIMKHNSQPTQY